VLVKVKTQRVVAGAGAGDSFFVLLFWGGFLGVDCFFPQNFTKLDRSPLLFFKN
jgi:hypothetical protein